VRLAAPFTPQQIQFHKNFDSMIFIVKVRRGAPYEAGYWQLAKNPLF